MCIRIKELRKQFGMTQDEMIAKFNARYNRSYSTSALSLIENGKRFPDIRALCDFADFFGVTLDYIVGRSTEPSEDVHDKGQEGKWVVSLKNEPKIYEIIKWYHEIPEDKQHALYHFAMYLHGKDTLLREMEEARSLKHRVEQAVAALKGDV